MDAGDDPFAPITIPNGLTTSSQEDICQFSLFADESGEAVTEDLPSESLLGDSIEEEEEEPVTQIIIESLPDSQNDRSSAHEDEDFQTPPEQATSQHFSSDDQAPPVKRLFGDRSAGSSGGGGGGEKEMEVDDWCGEGEGEGDGRRGVYLGDDTTDLGFEVRKRNVEIGARNGVSLADCSSADDRIEAIEVCDDERRKLARVEGEISVSRVCKKKLGAGTSNDLVMVEAEETEMENMGSKHLESEFKEVCAGLMDRMMEDTLNVSDKMLVRDLEGTVRAGQNKNAAIENPVRNLKASNLTRDSNKMGENGDCGSASKNIEDLEKFKYVSTGERRKLPFPLPAQDKNVAGESSVTMKRGFEDILDALKLMMGEADNDTEDVDFLDTAKKRGLTFPRPRWWPPEGSDS